MKRLRSVFESVAYAGMKPQGSAAPRPARRWLGPLRGPVERFLNGPGSSDPLYLSNRTRGQKVRLGVLIGLPCAMVLTFVALAALGKFDAAHLRRPPPVVSDAEVAARMLPGLSHGVAPRSDSGLEVLEVAVGGGRIASTVRNVRDHAIVDAEVTFELTDGVGSRLGAVNCRLPRIEARATAAFHAAIPQTDAVRAVVREMHVTEPAARKGTAVPTR